MNGRAAVARAAALAVAVAGCPKATPGSSDRASPSTVAPASSSGTVPAVAASVAPPAPPAPTGPPADLNVVLISVDSLRADMPWAGYARPIAPNLTALEKRAVSYTRAYSLSSYTSMSLGGLLGGKLPSELKRDGFFFGAYPKENVMFPELLQAAHVRTLAAQAHGYFKDAGFHQGFDKWEVVQGLKWNNTTDENVTSPQHEALAEKLLGDPSLDADGARFFAWFHFMDPHDMYIAHDRDRDKDTDAGFPTFGRGLRDRYDGEVAFADVYIGKLLDFIATRPWAKRTAIVVTADHGEAFGEHKQYSHGFEMWENLVHVPLFFVLPGVAPRHVDVPRSAVDLAPTFCALFGVAPDPSFEGTSLVGELYGTAPAEARDVVIDLPMTSDNDRRRALLHGDEKLIAFGNDVAFQLYDLAADPGEMSPITKGDAFSAMVARYRAMSKTVKEIPPYQCKENCLNGAYNKKDAGATP